MTIPLRENISFDKVVAGMTARTTDDGYMLALDFISALTGNDRKKASQTLARVVIKPETAGLFTLRQVGGKRSQRKLISIPNALQLLLMLASLGVYLVRDVLSKDQSHQFNATIGTEAGPLPSLLPLILRVPTTSRSS